MINNIIENIPNYLSLLILIGPGGVGGMDPFERRKPISAIKDEGLGMSDKRDYLTVRGSINYIKHDTDPWYSACPTCNKKVVQSMGGDKFRCEKCNLTLDECSYRYIVNFQLIDHSGNSWLTVFNDGEKILGGKTAKELFQMRTEGNDLGYEQVFSEALFKTYVCNISAKQEIGKFNYYIIMNIYFYS